MKRWVLNMLSCKIQISRSFVTFLFILFSFNAFSQSQIKFSENKGQWENNILFRAQLDGGALFLENNCFTYSFYEKEKLRALHHSVQTQKNKQDNIRSHSFKMHFKGAKAPETVSAKQRSKNYSNYFIGSQLEKWASHVYDYSTIYYRNIYTGIDLEVTGTINSIKYNFILAPFSSIDAICMKYEGISSITVDNGELKITTPLTSFYEKKPYAYQEIKGERIEIPCSFVLQNSEVRFSVEKNYNPAYPLIIDPILIFCSYSGSLADNFGMTATYDNRGNLYAGGTTFNQGYPVTIGAFDTTFNFPADTAITDVVISKFDSAGSNLIYSTYLGGGNGTEIVSSLIVNSANELMLLGTTGSSDFPVTSNAFDTTFNGGSFLYYIENGTKYIAGTDIYLAKLSSDGSQLLASTFVGGSQNDGVNSSSMLAFNYGDYYRGEIQTDSLDNFYVASCTYSSDFPVTPGSFQQLSGGGLDGCIFKMSPDLSTMLWCSYIGGSADDCAYSLTLDDSLNVFTDGGTASVNFPVTPGVISPAFLGVTDGFVSKIKFDGSSILKSTFIGTPAYDQSYFIQYYKTGSVYIYGQSLGNFPVSPGAYSNPNSKQFIAKLNDDLTVIQKSTVFGNGNGTINLSPSAFLIDSCENICCSGWGGNILTGAPTFNMPLTPNAIQPSNPDGFNFYFIVFSQDFRSLLYASYFGGNISQEHVDGGTSRFDRNGVVYQAVCAGCGSNSDLPTTPGAWSNTNNSNNCNMGVIKFNLELTAASASVQASPSDSGCSQFTVKFLSTITSVGATSFYWDFGDGSFDTVNTSPTHTYNNPGTYLATLYAFGTCKSDTVVLSIVVDTTTTASFSYSKAPCDPSVYFSNNSINASSYLWNFGDGDTSLLENPKHSYSSSGNYVVTLITNPNDICPDTLIQSIPYTDIDTTGISIPNVFSPNGDNLNDLFEIKGLGDCHPFELKIYNRWGKLLFETTDPAMFWDGKVENKTAEEGIYYYVLTTDAGDFHGTVTLMK